jgi:hypothetical protein
VSAASSTASARASISLTFSRLRVRREFMNETLTDVRQVAFQPCETLGSAARATCSERHRAPEAANIQLNLALAISGFPEVGPEDYVANGASVQMCSSFSLGPSGPGVEEAGGGASGAGCACGSCQIDETYPTRRWWRCFHPHGHPAVAKARR